MVRGAQSISLDAVKIDAAAGFFRWPVHVFQVFEEGLPVLRCCLPKHEIVDCWTQIYSNNGFEKGKFLLWICYFFSGISRFYSLDPNVDIGFIKGR